MSHKSAGHAPVALVPMTAGFANMTTDQQRPDHSFPDRTGREIQGNNAGHQGKHPVAQREQSHPATRRRFHSPYASKHSGRRTSQRAKGIFARRIGSFSNLLRHLVQCGSHHNRPRNIRIHRFACQGRALCRSPASTAWLHSKTQPMPHKEKIQKIASLQTLFS